MKFTLNRVGAPGWDLEITARKARALAGAVESALAPLGVCVDDLPTTPRRIVDWIEATCYG
jgi:hypothetical protein